MFAVSNKRHYKMEIEKVLRIVAIFIAAAAFAIHIATRLMFPESHTSDMPLLILLVFALCGIWSKTEKTKKENSNN